MQIDRRKMMKGALAAAVIAPAISNPTRAENVKLISRRIPAIGEDMPLVGLGSWITFNVGDDPRLRDECAGVMAAFFEDGGRMIDSSPMYGSSQATIGYGLKKLGLPKQLFSADKVWTSSQSRGPDQIARTQVRWGVPRFDLMQVHNLVNWRGHLGTLTEMKAAGRLRTVGITTSHGARHDTLEQIMASQPIDFVQVTYNIQDREVEQRILPLAQEKGIAVIINRPYRRGELIKRLSSKSLPGWIAETGGSSWAQFLLKFVISHPAVTCAIPATTRVDHVRENLATATGALPDMRLRQRMIDYVGQL